MGADARQRGIASPGFPPEFGGHGDFGADVAAFETLAFGDLSLLVKFGVQFGLWGGAVQQLGTRSHHARYLKDTASLVSEPNARASASPSATAPAGRP